MNDEKHRGLRATGIPFARYVLVFVAILGLLLLGPLGATAQNITIDNGVAAGDPAHLSIVIRKGSRSLDLTVGTTDQLSSMFGILDLGPDGVFRMQIVG